MANPIPNVPLEHCMRVARIVRETSNNIVTTGGSAGMMSPDVVANLLSKIADNLDELAVEIQQDQSGEI